MDMEKEIEEIAKVVCDICFNAPHGTPCPEGLEKVCSFANGEFANSIAHIIERKAEEVRKETLREILEGVRELSRKNVDVAYLGNDPMLRFLAKGKEEGFRIVCEYLINLIGVEVDE